ncbi:MAG: prepilin-type N-terminal cleavage/methylation domain-containing protein [Candidatus Ozemobacteraceae bacterium]
MRVIGRSRPRGLTFLEIMIGLVIIAVAMLPVFNMIHKGAEDTDLSASQSFATNKATEILNTCLDNVPFEVIRMGCPFGYLSVENLTGIKEYADNHIDAAWLDRMARMLFNLDASAKIGNQYPSQGVLTDPRGISYLATLRVEDICDRTPASRKAEKATLGSEFPDLTPAELTFSFCQNPDKLQDPNWITKYHPDSTIRNEIAIPGIGVSLPPTAIYNESDFTTPRTIRYTQRHSTEKVNYTNDDAFAFCTMKRLIIEIQWNLDQAQYAHPDVQTANSQRIHLMTIKADVQR